MFVSVSYNITLCMFLYFCACVCLCFRMCLCISVCVSVSISLCLCVCYSANPMLSANAPVASPPVSDSNIKTKFVGFSSCCCSLKWHPSLLLLEPAFCQCATDNWSHIWRKRRDRRHSGMTRLMLASEACRSHALLVESKVGLVRFINERFVRCLQIGNSYLTCCQALFVTKIE